MLWRRRHCAQSVRVPPCWLHVDTSFSGCTQGSNHNVPLGSFHDGKNTAETEHEICLVRDKNGSFESYSMRILIS